MKLRWDKWLLGLGAAFIGGGSAAVVGGFTSALAFKVDISTWSGAGKILSLMLINFVLSGIFSMFFYLKQDAVPQIVSDTSFTTNTKRENPDGSVQTMVAEVTRTTTVTPPEAPEVKKEG